MKQLFMLPLLLLPAFQHAGENTAKPTTGEQPKNIILMIGDGMGLTQITAGLYSNGNSLNLEKFPVTGLITTHAAKHIVTDSGAGATAFS